MNSAANTVSERAKELKLYASGVSERVSDSVSALKKRLEKAYIGNISEAEEHEVDNQFILRGYRINHNKCKDLCRSLFTSHNESVNVWSHICGVVVFVTLLTIVCVQVIPSQFWYAYELNNDFTDYQDKYGDTMTTASNSMANAEIFANSKITDLISYSDDVQAMQVSS